MKSLLPRVPDSQDFSLVSLSIVCICVMSDLLANLRILGKETKSSTYSAPQITRHELMTSKAKLYCKLIANQPSHKQFNVSKATTDHKTLFLRLRELTPVTLPKSNFPDCFLPSWDSCGLQWYEDSSRPDIVALLLLLPASYHGTPGRGLPLRRKMHSLGMASC